MPKVAWVISFEDILGGKVQLWWVPDSGGLGGKGPGFIIPQDRKARPGEKGQRRHQKKRKHCNQAKNQ